MEDETKHKAEEPAAEYGKKRIMVFNSFEEENEYTQRQYAALSYEERMTNLETLRKRIFYKLLNADGNWSPLLRKLEIIKLPYEVCR